MPSLPAYAQETGGANVIMRRAIPGMERANAPDDTEDPDDGASEPVEDTIPETHICPPGHVCLVPDEGSEHSNLPVNQGYSVWLTCDGDGEPVFTCDLLTRHPNGAISYSEGPVENCLKRQSPEADAIAIANGDRPPGHFYDLTAICAGETDESGEGGESGPYYYGYLEYCPEPGENPTCYRLDVGEGTLDVADSMDCDSFTADETVAWEMEMWNLVPHDQLASNFEQRGCDWTPGSEHGFTFTPTGPEPGYGSDLTNLRWQVGPWQGAMTCGSQATLTREVRCLAERDNGDGTAEAAVAPYWQCETQVFQSPPATGYSGTGANCGYTADISHGEWSSDPRSCKKYRYNNVTCSNSDGDQVSVEFCQQGLVSGGSYASIQKEEADLEDCTAKWEAVAESPTCNGPVQMATVSYECRWSDGTLAGDSECDGNKPAPTHQNVGACVRKADFTDREFGNCGGTVTGVMTTTANYPGITNIVGDLGHYIEARDQCVASGASCCSIGTYGGKGRVYTHSGEFDPEGLSIVYPPDVAFSITFALLIPQWYPEGYQERLPTYLDD